MRTARGYRGWLTGLACVVSLGCGGGSDVEREPTYPVTGIITMNDEPLEGAVVSFQPAGGGQAAIGTTDATGKYSLTTWAKDDGAAAGMFRVTVTKYEDPPEGEAAPEATETTETAEVDFAAEDFDEYGEGVDPLTAEEQAAIIRENMLPQKYADPNSSELKAEVVADKENTHNFNLEK